MVGGKSIVEWLSWAGGELAEFAPRMRSPTRMFDELVQKLDDA
jgi:hypothetical protein